MKNQLFLPFRVSYLDKTNNKYRFIVNAGDINSFIFNTYKANFTNTSLDKDIYNAVNEFKKPTFDYQKKWEATFSTNESCDVYLTIPKIPIGFDSNSITTPEKYKGPDWWNGDPPYDFINQFKIVTSNQQAFQEDYNNNILYIEKDNVYKNLKGTVFTEDSSYPGKIYIKIATITVQNDTVNIKRYLNSNVISPTKYLRLGALGIRNIQILYSLISDGYGEFLVPDSSGRIARSGIEAAFLSYGGGYYNDPSLFFSSISQIKESVESKIKNSITAINNNYFYDAFYRTPLDTTWGQKFKKNSILIYQIVLIYKESLGGKIIVERIVNNKAQAQALVDAIGAKNAAIAEEAAREFVNEDGTGVGETDVIGTGSLNPVLEEGLNKNEILKLMSIKDKILVDEELVDLNVDDLFEFIGFEEDEPEQT
jgi:hypothetical protein